MDSFLVSIVFTLYHLMRMALLFDNLPFDIEVDVLVFELPNMFAKCC